MPDFSLDRLPDVPRGATPPEVHASPFADQAREYHRLTREFDTARAELSAIATKAPAAAAQDRAALAAGKPDPGDPRTAKLHEQFVAQRCRVEGLRRRDPQRLRRLRAGDGRWRRRLRRVPERGGRHRSR